MADPTPQSDRSPWLLGLATANFVVLAAASWFVGGRLTALEERTDRRITSIEASMHRGGASPADPKPGSAEEKSLSGQITKLSSDVYDDYSEIMGDLHEIKQTTKQLNSAVRNIGEGIRKPGGTAGSSSLAPYDKAPSAEALAQYRKDAEAAGVKIAPGRVEVRGFLNMSPNSSMPIEYFVTRWPENGHETLVHVIGPTDYNAELTTEKLRGLVRGIYKGLVVAGFMQGKGSGWDGDPNDPEKKMKWVPPTGDKVYVGVRYEAHGKSHVARATDWVVDPAARSVLAEDAFRFTGSRRTEDFNTGDEELSGEVSGLVVSVYRDPNTLIEIALPSNLNDNYAYNYSRIPKPAVLLMGKGGPRLDCTRDRAKATLTVFGRIENGTGKTVPLAAAPILVLNAGEPEAKEIPFSANAAAPGAFTVQSDLLKTGVSWKVRAIVDGATVESEGFEPIYLDLILSKTPIVPEGDGAKPLEAVDLPKEDPPEPATPPAMKPDDRMDK